MPTSNDLMTLGWREWVSLPDLGIRRINAKIDTGARTSSLHALNLRCYCEDERQRVEFTVHPSRRDNEIVTTCHADILDIRTVKDSGGHCEERIVIETLLSIGTAAWPIEVALTARDSLRYRMLLGRTAVRGRARVDPASSYLVDLGKQ